MNARKINQRWIDSKIKATGKRHSYSLGGTLVLQVTAAGSGSYAQRLFIDGRRKDIALGPCWAVDYKTARQQADKNRAAVKFGFGQPQGIRQALVKAEASRDVPTFRDIAEQVLADKEREGISSIDAWRQTLRDYAMPTLGDMRVSEIRPVDVADAMQRNNAWVDKHPTLAMTLPRVVAVLDRAVALEYIASNPADKATAILPKINHKAENRKSCDYRDLPAVIQAMRERAPKAVALAFELAALTSCRISEALNAQTVWINSVDRLLCIPADAKGRKTGRQHMVPLCDRAMQIVREAKALAGDSVYLFPNRTGRGPLDKVAVGRALRKINAPLTAHGLRSCFRDWCGENEIDRELAELSLSHTIGSQAEQAYRRSTLIERRRAVMAKWGAFLTA